MEKEKATEVHPFEPFIPEHARVLIMGTFPPQPKRWSMEFYYPNRTNDFWPMTGLIFLHDREALLDRPNKTYRLDLIKKTLREHGIALNDTGHRIHRAMGNASDKFLEILEPVDLAGLLERMPECHDVATTGEKAAGVIAGMTGTKVPKVGECVDCTLTLKDDTIARFRHWRMPSTSRAYPLALEKKAAAYEKMFRDIGLI